MFYCDEARDIFSGNILMRTGSRELWDRTYKNLPYQTFYYSHSSLDISLEYEKFHGSDVQDLSMIFIYNSSPVGIWPISISRKNGKNQLTTFGMAVLPPLFDRKCPLSYQKKIIKNCFQFAKKISATNQIISWNSSESFLGWTSLSEWHIELLANGVHPRILYEGYVDLSFEKNEIKSQFRKSYKNLINIGQRNWEIGLLRGGAEAKYEIWEEFHSLHANISGRETRSLQTWLMQYEDIKNNRSFLIWLRDKSGKLVGGGYFDITRDEGLYDCGAYDRSLFSMPLGHVIQDRAIEELKKLGCKFYKIGRLHNKYDIPPPTEKEISIAKFKKGFSTLIFPKYYYEVS